MQTLEKMFGLDGHRAVVTGASSGLGVAFAEALAAAGADIVLVARRADRLKENAARLSDDYGVRTGTVAADLGDLEAIDGAWKRCEDAFGEVDILVNNAGVNDPARAERMSIERWRRVIDVNLNAVWALSAAFARSVIGRKGEGRIVNVSSIHGAVAAPNPGLAAYNASKGAVEMATRQMAVEWAGRGIRVNAIAPGYFPTELNEDALGSDGYGGRLLQFTPMGRFGRSEELHTALLFLVSSASTYVTGTTVTVDGGYTAW